MSDCLRTKWLWVWIPLLFIIKLCWYVSTSNFPLSKTRLKPDWIFRSNHHRCSLKTDVLRNFTKFTATHLCQSLFFNKVAGLSSATLLKKRLWHRCFPVNFAKFLRICFLQNSSGRLLHCLYQLLHSQVYHNALKVY